jgi:S1-C subfamily serine protease
MRRSALYSSSVRLPGLGVPEVVVRAPLRQRIKTGVSAARKMSVMDPRVLWAAIVILGLLLMGNIALQIRPGTPKLTQEIIDNAVLKTLETADLPSAAARAAEAIAPSVVRVMGLVKNADGDADIEHGVGTGVVIVDKGIILTNLHVVQGAETIRITFSDGLETTATIKSVKPEDDLAVLQAKTIPDDMIAATMRSTGDLKPGDHVVAVGFPFGIGPSTSAGVVSGLKRSFRSPEGKQEMTNLIQFDAAANPGNSGGPLVTMDGQVVGIVTAILNPNDQRTFIGIGFAVPIENAAGAAGLPPF